MRILILAILLNAVAYGAEFAVAVPGVDGNIVIQNPLIQPDKKLSITWQYASLSYTIINNTPFPWASVSLKFDIDDKCTGKDRHWSHIVQRPLGWINKSLQGDEVILYFGTQTPKDGVCEEATFKVTLLSVEDKEWRIDGTTGARVNKQAEALAASAAREEEARKAAAEMAERAKKAAADEATREKRREEARRSEEAAKEVELARIRTACGIIYSQTANKRVSNLTVKEEQQVRACQALNLYPPR